MIGRQSSLLLRGQEWERDVKQRLQMVCGIEVEGDRLVLADLRDGRL